MKILWWNQIWSFKFILINPVQVLWVFWVLRSHCQSPILAILVKLGWFSSSGWRRIHIYSLRHHVFDYAKGWTCEDLVSCILFYLKIIMYLVWVHKVLNCIFNHVLKRHNVSPKTSKTRTVWVPKRLKHWVPKRSGAEMSCIPIEYHRCTCKTVISSRKFLGLCTCID